MKKRYPFTNRDKKDVGAMRLEAASTDRAELHFYGDIASCTWDTYRFNGDKCPQDVANFLAALDNYPAVDIYINSGGGSVHGGLAIYNILKRYAGETVVHVDGLAASIASVIALAGDRVVVPKTAQLMIHNPWTWAMGNAEELRKEAEALDSCREAILAVYMQHAREGVTEQQIIDMMDRETWLAGEQAAQYFAVEVDDTAQAVAWAPHFMQDYQPRQPEDLKKKELDVQLQFMQDYRAPRLDELERERLELQLQILTLQEG